MDPNNSVIKRLWCTVEYTDKQNRPSSNCFISIIVALIKSSIKFVCVEVLWPSQPNGVMSSAVSLPNHTFTGQA